MVIFHLLYDLTELFRLVRWRIPDWGWALSAAGGKIFLLLSGVCVTLGNRPVRRGLTVLGAGLGISAVTFLLWKLGFDGSVRIFFGVLHCLGVCMLLWPLFRRLQDGMLLLLGLLITAAGVPAGEAVADTWALLPFGVAPAGFATADYYPLIPNLGWFLLGSLAGRRLYGERKTRFPGVDPDRGIIALLRWVGIRSLPLYLLHQPVLSFLCLLPGAA